MKQEGAVGLRRAFAIERLMKKCPNCSRTYSDHTFSFCLDDGALLSASFDPDATLVLPTTKTVPASVRNDYRRETLPIFLVPSDPDRFKQELLRTRIAEIVTSYLDGRVETKIWKAVNFRPSSNVMGNLRSRPEFRTGKWQAAGIAKVTVRVFEHAR
jgi:hypothetical protein